MINFKRIFFLLSSLTVFSCSLPLDILVSDGNLSTELPEYQNSLPSYDQYEIDGKNSGCVPTAFAMATGYWYLQNDEKLLYKTAPPLFMSSGELDDVVTSEIQAIRTTINTDSTGVTTPSDALNSKNYIKVKV